MPENKTITVLGAGLWGTVLAQHLAGQGRSVKLWEFFPSATQRLRASRRHPHLPGLRIHDSIDVTSDLGVARQSGVLLFVLPSQHMRATAKALAKIIGTNRPVVVSASKGIEPGSLLTQTGIIASEIPSLGSKLYSLSGPSFAREVARGVPTNLLLAGPRGKTADGLLALFNGGALKTDWIQDRKGVELGGSLKNVLAIGCGILDGLKAGSNTKAALIVKGLDEMGELCRRFGGQAQTIYGLAGLGDLIATGTSEESRNRGFGEKLGSGLSPAQARKKIATVVEGMEASESAYALARRLKVEAPLIRAIRAAVHEGGSPRGVVKALGFNRY